MSEKAQRRVRFNYKENANLVLQADYTLFDRRSRSEPSGEAESLVGKLGGIKMGDRAKRVKPSKPNEKSTKSQKKKSDSSTPKISHSLIDADEFEGLTYIPKSKETKQIYDMLIDIIQKEIGYDHTRDIIYGASDEVINVLKSRSLNDSQKKDEVLNLLGNVEGEVYSALVNLAAKLTDYSSEISKVQAMDADYDNLESGQGINVRIDDSDSSDSDDNLKGDISESSNDEEGIDGKQIEPDQNEKSAAKSDKAKASNDLTFDAKEIDAFWLQRKISASFPDPNTAHKKASEVIKILQTAKDEREIENRLISELGYQLFDLIKLIRKNRYTIYYCVQLASASINDKQKIEEEIMSSDNPQIRSVMDVLRKEGKVESTASSSAKKNENEVDDLQDFDTLEEFQKQNKFVTTEKLALLDLDEMAFMQGSLLMTNKKCVLADGSVRNQHKGYEEIFVPAGKSSAYGEKEKLVMVNTLPAYMQHAFDGFKSLNRIQSRIYDRAVNSDENLLICAPTGSGKTNVALLTMMREIGKNTMENGVINLDDFKIIYIAPMKSLAQEMATSFGKILADYGINVAELTGDHQLKHSEIMSTQILICTPEKWDIITRKGDERLYSQLVSLVIFDEVHLLHDERGPIIESLVVRLQKNAEYGLKAPRIVGLSATLPNYEDVCLFLDVDTKTGLFHFDNSYRPVPLEQTFIGLTEKKPLKRLKMMDEIIYEKITSTNSRNQVLIFVHSRKETGRTANTLREMLMENEMLGILVPNDSGAADILKMEADQVKDDVLKDLLPHGLGIHHAGMSKVDRTLVEDLFADGHVKVLVSTSTLAWGVNLPAHSVIIKGTTIYNPEKGQWVELGLLDIMQMLGRAGRPQYDSKGEGMLITTHSQLQYYLSVMNEQLPVESQLIAKLADCLNAEIALRNVRNISDAVNWLSYSYLYIRILRNPQLYGVSYDELRHDVKLQQVLSNLAHSALTQLDKAGLIKYDRKSGILQPTDLSKIASYFYCTHKSMQTYSKLLKSHISEIELCRVFSMSSEYSLIKVRNEEKLELQRLVERVPIPLKESIDESSAKVNVLLQAYISQLKLDGFALLSDMVYVSQNGARLMRALFTIAIERKWVNVALKALKLSKCVNRRMWSSMSPLRQFKNVPDEVISKLEKRNLPWDVLSEMEAHEIGEILRMPKIGKNIHKYVHLVPKVDISASVQPLTRTTIKIDLKITADFNWDEKSHGTAQLFWIFISDQDSEVLLHSQKFLIKAQNCTDEHNISINVSLGEPLPPQYFIICTSDTWLGSDVELPVSFHQMIPVEKFHPPSELLDLQSLPVSNFNNATIEDIYKAKFSFFNAIQTQTFTHLYSSDDSLLLCAPHGSGKLTCAEIALYRHFTQKSTKSPAILITCLKETAQNIVENWSKKLKRLSKSVGLLKGNLASDMLALETYDVIVVTAEHWDAVSRRWKQKKIIQGIELYILYGLERLNTDHGITLEMIGSRVRYISMQTEKKVRIIGLGYSIANYKDIGHWLGVSPNHTFNFHPSARPLPLELHVQLFEQMNYRTRVSSMVRSSFKTLLAISRKKPSLVFVSSNYLASLVAYSYIQILVGLDDDKYFFNGMSRKEMAKYQNIAENRHLKELLMFGIGIISESLSQNDVQLIKSLYNAGAIKLCIVTNEFLYRVPLKSYLSIILDLQYYDGSTNDYANYSIHDTLFMVNSANRPVQDTMSKCFLFCHPVQYDFYRKFIQEPLPIESQLDLGLNDHINAEIVTKTIENKQDVIDYLTWTFFYRRLTQNPNFYGLTGVSHRYISDYLSQLVESSCSYLESSNCIEILEDIDTKPASLGLISAYYYLSCESIVMFSKSYTERTKLKGLLEVISNVTELTNQIFLREKEPEFIKMTSQNLPYKSPKFEGFKWERQMNAKVLFLIQSHLSRIDLPNEMKNDISKILPICLRLVHASIDVIASNSWLNPVLTSMELSQYLVQATWPKDAVLAQIPHFMQSNVIQMCKDNGIDSVYEFLENEKKRDEILNLMNETQKADIIKFCNSYPNIEMEYEFENRQKKFARGEQISVVVTLTLDADEDDLNPNGTISNYVVSQNYPDKYEQGWWLVMGNPAENSLLAIKKFNIRKPNMQMKLSFDAPNTVGELNVNLYLISDCIVGCDQEYALKATILK